MILVTGGTGLVGSNLLAKLVTKNKPIRAIYRKSSNLDTVKKVFSYYHKDYLEKFHAIEWMVGDLNDIASLEKAYQNIETVYHCAAIVSFNKKDYQAMRTANIEGTANMVNLAIANNINKFCYVSSIATIEKNANPDTLITEENEWNKETNNYGYAITKYGAEMEVWRATQEGLDVVIVNPGVILGSGFWHNGPGELFTKAYKEFRFYTEGVTGFVSVKDVVIAMIALMESSITNERFILVSENISFKELFYKMTDAFHKKRPSIKVGKTLSNIAWRMEAFKSFITKKPPLITKHSASASLSKYKYDNSKIKRAINFNFEPIELTIKNICYTYLKEKRN
ncbi:MAG TPA: NAD-dependent epimerase/dehydratase family protein [Flavobacteriia bacterium]|nr:NAD-dependent epimerase/dehydratase family protein [Flavobacteriia bacterium]